VIGGPAWGGGVDDDAGMQALETDVMRFMAILAFCLLAVFALVQSVPWSPQVAEVAEKPAAPAVPAVAGAGPAASAAQKIAAKIPEPNTPPPGENIKRDAPRTFVPAPQMQKESLASLPDQPDAVPAPVAATGAAEIIRNNATATPALSAGDMTEVATASDLPPLPEVPAEPATQQHRGGEKSSPLPVSEDRQQGFTLRFVSDEAMFALIESGSVSLFAYGEKTAWRLATSSGRYSFHAAAPPSQIYEMTPTTVPPELRRALRRRANVAVESVSWGVVLPAATRAAIAAAMSDAGGGQLSIQADGLVRLE
jgi:hypothetical protein